MEIVRKEKRADPSEQLPQIINRIYSVCKEDPSFPLRDKIRLVESEVLGVKKKLASQALLLKKSRDTRQKLISRLAKLEQRNTEIREDLLRELGS